MTTLVMTVPHSGTNFLCSFLTAHLGLDGRDYLMGPGASADFCRTHPHKSTEINVEDYDAVIITLRHPLRTVETHKRYSKIDDASIQFIEDSWRALMDEAMKAKKIIYLVIDGPEENRLPQLQAIANHFGKGHMTDVIEQYAADWRPLNSSVTDANERAMQFAIEAYEKWQQ